MIQKMLAERAREEVEARVLNFGDTSSLATMIGVYADSPDHWQYTPYFITAIREAGYWPAVERRLSA